MHVRRAIILVVCTLILFLSFNEAHMTTRYGKKNFNNEDLRPRISKNSPSFLVGPRYGKRMAWSPGEEHYSSPAPCSTFEDLTCDYTGLSNYYRCSLRRDSSVEEFDESN